MPTSRRAFIRENVNPNNPNDQWNPIQFIGAVETDNWAATIAATTNPNHAPLQWVNDLSTITATEIPEDWVAFWALFETPISHYVLARKGLRNGNSPGVWDAYLVLDSKAKIEASIVKYAAKYPDVIFVIFASDRDIDLTGRKNQQQGARK